MGTKSKNPLDLQRGWKEGGRTHLPTCALVVRVSQPSTLRACQDFSPVWHCWDEPLSSSQPAVARVGTPPQTPFADKVDTLQATFIPVHLIAWLMLLGRWRWMGCLDPCPGSPTVTTSDPPA